MFGWLKRLFEKPHFSETYELARLTVHAIRCEVCEQALKDGDVLMRINTLRGKSSARLEVKKISSKVVNAHLECLVIIEGQEPPAHLHRNSIFLTQEEYDAWVQLGKTPEWIP